MDMYSSLCSTLAKDNRRNSWMPKITDVLDGKYCLCKFAISIFVKKTLTGRYSYIHYRNSWPKKIENTFKKKQLD